MSDLLDQGPSGDATVDASGEASSSTPFIGDDKHVIFQHFKFKSKEMGRVQRYWCKHCGADFMGTASRCAQHLTDWEGMGKRGVRKCIEAPTDARAAVRAFQEAKVDSRAAQDRADMDALEAYIGGAGLQQCRRRIEDALIGISESWSATGVTIASDMMTDRRGRPQANIMLVNDSGAVFAESVDCKMEKKTGGYIAGFLRPIVEKLGAANVVAFCTDGGSNYYSACKLLIQEFPKIEHVPCATHVLDLLMEDVGKLPWAAGVVKEASDIITYMRSHHWTRQYVENPDVAGGKGLQVLRPAGTRFGTQYIAVSRLVAVHEILEGMVVSELWKKNWAVGSRKAAADAFKKQILDEKNEWWPKAELFTRVLELPFNVMRATDTEKKGMMGSLYDKMLLLTEQMEALLKKETHEVLTSTAKSAINEIVTARWDGSLACPLHVVGRILNPINQSADIFGPDVECTNVFKDFVQRHYEGVMVPQKRGPPKRATLVIQEGLADYLELRGSFGKKEAITDRQLVKEGTHTMKAWWRWHGTDHPLLTALAHRVLTQPVSAASCERNWAVWDAIHTARRNRLGSQKLSDLVYVAHNWNVVRNWHEEGMGVVVGNIPDPPLPAGKFTRNANFPT
ncbi:hypothetical protein CLOM_g2 [Closterium sp. NIES-68]|nr:hypothetical protein CLOM_g2 [Closterium sp. NIES-68]